MSYKSGNTSMNKKQIVYEIKLLLFDYSNPKDVRKRYKHLATEVDKIMTDALCRKLVKRIDEGTYQESVTPSSTIYGFCVEAEMKKFIKDNEKLNKLKEIPCQIK